jgi:D-glycero-D-manno-heptose 1,7-bisphosphate phosphatase
LFFISKKVSIIKIAIFLDRDGVVNEEVHLLHKPEDLKLIPRSAEAIAKLNQANIPVILITNQPVVARGLCTNEDINIIHNHLQKLLEQKNAKLDAIYYCPHHPNFTKECECRKPLPGLILKAEKDFNINLTKSYMIGDRISDIKAGFLAGCKTIGVKTGYACDDGFKDATPDMMANDLYHAVEIILERCKNDY